MDAIIHESDQNLWNNHVHHINHDGDAEILDIRIVTQCGKMRWIKHICAPVTDENGDNIGVRASNIDITTQKDHQNQVYQMAYFDSLTQLPNRRLCEKSLCSLIESAKINNDVFCVMFVDLDRFKNINDSFGHRFGDDLLVVISQVISNQCNRQCEVYRFTGDQFVLLCPQVKTRTQASDFAKNIIQRIECPIIIDDITIYMSANIGVAYYPEDGADFDHLVKNADISISKSKKDLNNKVLFYQSVFSDEASHFITTEQSIHKALEDNEFVPYYQPKIDMSTGKIIGAEALARWIKKDGLLLGPDKFIDISEETNQIIAISKQITEKVLVDMQQWEKLNCAFPVSINVSVRQFASASYFSELLALVKEYNISPKNLDLEITEQLFLGDLVIAKTRLDEFRHAGFKIVLDDFGTGYSSMSYLSDLTIDTLKIDKSFIDGLTKDSKALAIIKAIISLSSDLGCEIIAEGVESEEQKNGLLGLHCNIAQGYYFYRPMPEEELTVLLTKQQKE
jgi:diguanylate cyclase (GGDEF)-like protein